ncbi:protein MAIN-LIKE 2-like [Argentina anserina]|uniref:protein MAIN-LIKE 2-like n=1 Tax=Argentina anserina TaxID=57926 RepID=UPI0021768896|nr:protein MAIN-LIKE 2-like [Potentilla anserina]
MESFTLVEKRLEVMLSSPKTEDTIIRKALFLKPIVPLDTKEPLSHLPSYSFPSLPLNFEPKEWSLKVSFPCWLTRIHDEAWNSWVDDMASKHQDLWKSAGLFEPILCSKYHINQDKRLVYGLAEKWCCDTNTFIFQWGEATLTLEDVMVLGGFPVLGDSIVAYSLNSEEIHIEEYLDNARKQFNKTKSKKPTTSLWMQRFMKNQSEYEHQAFIAYWLSRYVFQSYVIEKRAITLAIQLATGRRVDLASAVLSNIYRDLTLLKLKILHPSSEKVIIKSPFHLVQLWAWERFPKLSPEPRVISPTTPRLARWFQIKGVKINNWRRALDSVIEADFKWRPYARIHQDDEKIVMVGSDLGNDDTFIFAICLASRKHKLIGFDSEEIYRPHHVAKQFGYDQDLPCCTTLLSVSDLPDVYYANLRLDIPAGNLDVGVSLRYSNWWKFSILGNSSPFPPGFPPK